MLNKQLLNVKDLYVDVEDKEILHGVDLSIGEGETHVLMGPNGTGKSTLGYALMGNPRYTVKSCVICIYPLKRPFPATSASVILSR